MLWNNAALQVKVTLLFGSERYHIFVSNKITINSATFRSWSGLGVCDKQAALQLVTIPARYCGSYDQNLRNLMLLGDNFYDNNVLTISHFLTISWNVTKTHSSQSTSKMQFNPSIIAHMLTMYLTRKPQMGTMSWDFTGQNLCEK